jgi:hypothetical protein
MATLTASLDEARSRGDGPRSRRTRSKRRS